MCLGSGSLIVARITPSYLNKAIINVCTTAGLFLAVAAAFAQGAPTHFVLYYTAPVILGRMVALEWICIQWMSSPDGRLQGEGLGRPANLKKALSLLLIVESMVATFFNRRFLCFTVITITLWQLYHHRSRGTRMVKFVYVLCSLGISALTFRVG
jgi:hypothetical protein